MGGDTITSEKMIKAVFWKGRDGVYFLVMKEEGDRVLIFTESPEKARRFGLEEEIEPGKYGKWVNADEVKVVSAGIRDDLVKWRGELMLVDSHQDGKLLLSTGDYEKAKRLGLPHIDKGEWGTWVPEEEVEVIGNFERYWPERKRI